MTVSLVQILAEVLKTEGDNLTQAKKDQKLLKSNKAGIKLSRGIIAAKLRELKAKRLQIDRTGGGASSAAVASEIEFLRKVLNDMTEEFVMVRIQHKQCGLYIKAQTERVRSIDAEWEKAKAAETANETETTTEA